MNVYAYSVVPEEIDFKGRITVPSLCGHIINAIGQNIRKEGFGIDVMAKDSHTLGLRNRPKAGTLFSAVRLSVAGIQRRHIVLPVHQDY